MNQMLPSLLVAASVSGVCSSSVFAQDGGNYRAKPVPAGSVPTPSDDDLIRGQLGGADGPAGPGFDLNWYTMDGGGATYLTGGTFQLGATAGQPDAGFMSGGVFELGGGFWYGVVPQPSCYANCDNSTTLPVLNANDFNCFLNAYAANLAYANCDQSTTLPVLNANDFSCFLNAYAAGCT